MQLFTLPFLGILTPAPLTGVVYALLVYYRYNIAWTAHVCILQLINTMIVV